MPENEPQSQPANSSDGIVPPAPPSEAALQEAPLNEDVREGPDEDFDTPANRKVLRDLIGVVRELPQRIVEALRH